MLKELDVFLLAQFLHLLFDVEKQQYERYPAFSWQLYRFCRVFQYDAYFIFYSLDRKNAFLSQRIHDVDDECEDGGDAVFLYRLSTLRALHARELTKQSPSRKWLPRVRNSEEFLQFQFVEESNSISTTHPALAFLSNQ